MNLTPEQLTAATALGDEPRLQGEVDAQHLRVLRDGHLLEVNGAYVGLCRPLWAIQHFPQPGNAAEIEVWRPHIVHRALHQFVLCVATTRIEGAWAAYCRNVPGQSHRAEVQPVLDEGDALPEGVARALFPEFLGVPYAR